MEFILSSNDWIIRNRTKVAKVYLCPHDVLSSLGRRECDRVCIESFKLRIKVITLSAYGNMIPQQSNQHNLADASRIMIGRRSYSWIGDLVQSVN